MQPVKHLLVKFSKTSTPRHLATLAEEVARACWPDVWAKVSFEAPGKSTPRLRGLVTAHVSRFVDPEIDAVLRKNRLGTQDRDSIADQASARIIELALLEACTAGSERGNYSEAA